MSPVNYQCFILPKEALSDFLDYQEKWSLYLYMLLTEENRLEVKPIASIEISCEDIGRQTLALSTCPIRQGIILIREFEQTYPDTLFFRIGEYTQKYMRESWLYSLKISTDDNANCLWKRVKNLLSKRMCKGGFCVYTSTMKRNYVRRLRYTPAALEYYKNGGLCLPETGRNIIYELGSIDE